MAEFQQSASERANGELCMVYGGVASIAIVAYAAKIHICSPYGRHTCPCRCRQYELVWMVVFFFLSLFFFRIRCPGPKAKPYFRITFSPPIYNEMLMLMNDRFIGIYLGRSSC